MQVRWKSRRNERMSVSRFLAGKGVCEATRDMTKIYTYGIVDSNNAIADPIKGLGGAEVYNIPYLDIGILASNVHEKVKNANPKHVLEHEEVVEKLMENFTILPMRFCTIFDKRENVLSMMKEYYADFKENLDNLRNKVEFGIKVIWPGDMVKKRISDMCNKNSHIVSAVNSPGKTFINEKYRTYKIDKEFEKEADRCIAAIDNFFRSAVIEKKYEKLESNNLLLSASYLVEKGNQDDFKQAFERLTKSVNADFKYLFSGPWPPYNFINLKKKGELRQWIKK